MTSRDRVRAAFEDAQPDYTRCDYFAIPEIHQGLMRHFRLRASGEAVVTTAGKTHGDDEIREILGVDIRCLRAPTPDRR